MEICYSDSHCSIYVVSIYSPFLHSLLAACPRNKKVSLNCKKAGGFEHRNHLETQWALEGHKKVQRESRGIKQLLSHVLIASKGWEGQGIKVIPLTENVDSKVVICKFATRLVEFGLNSEWPALGQTKPAWVGFDRRAHRVKTGLVGMSLRIFTHNCSKSDSFCF